MVLILGFVFVTAFVIIVLLMTATGAGASQQTKQTLAFLDSTLSQTGPVEDEAVDIRRQELLSAIPWLNRWLIEMELAPRLRMLLYQANLKWTVGGLILMSISAAVFTGWVIYLRTGFDAVMLLLAVLAGACPLLFVLQKRSRRFADFEEKLPECLDLMVGALRAGHSLISAVGMVAKDGRDPVAQEFRICFDEQNFGLELRTAMLNLVRRVPIQDMRIVSTAILIQKESGGNLAEVLEKVAAIIRDRFRLKKQISVHTAQGRITGWILAVLPVVLGIAMYLVNPDHISILWKRDIGIKMMWTAGVMTILGGLVIRKIIRIRV